MDRGQANKAPYIDQRFGETVRSLRTDWGWSQEQLAQKMQDHDVKDAAALTISRLESGKRKVRLDEAIALSTIFGVSVQRLAAPDHFTAGVSDLARLDAELSRAELALAQTLDERSAAVIEAATTLIYLASFIRQETRVSSVDPDVLQRLDKMEKHAYDALIATPKLDSRYWAVPADLLVDHEMDTTNVREAKANLRLMAEAGEVGILRGLETDGEHQAEA